MQILTSKYYDSYCTGTFFTSYYRNQCIHVLYKNVSVQLTKMYVTYQTGNICIQSIRERSKIIRKTKDWYM